LTPEQVSALINAAVELEVRAAAIEDRAGWWIPLAAAAQIVKLMKPRPELPEIVEPPCWEVSPPTFSEFLQHLPAFAPNSILCLEGVSAPDLEAYLLERPAAYENETKQGFLGLRAKIFYMPITETNLRGFAALTERYAEPEVCDHVRVYRGNRIMLSWHDLPFDPIYVVKEYDEDVLKEFCQRCKRELSQSMSV